MSIEIGSKWVKDGEVVEVENIKYNHFDNNRTSRTDCVWFWDKQGSIHVLTERDFLEQYKHVTFEYMYAFNDAHNICRLPTSNFYKDDEEFELYHPNKTEYQRLDFTKRERKQ